MLKSKSVTYVRTENVVFMEFANLQDLQKMFLGLRGPLELPLVDWGTLPQVKAGSHLGPCRPTPLPPGTKLAYPFTTWDRISLTLGHLAYLGPWQPTPFPIGTL